MFTSMHFVDAASVSAVISVSQDSVVKGNSGTATLTIQSDGNISITEGTFSCGALGNLDLTWAAQSLEQAQSSKTFQIKWTGNTVGSYTCSISGVRVGLANAPEEGMKSVTATSKTINVIGEVVSNNHNDNSENNNKTSGNNNSSKNNGTVTEKKEYKTGTTAEKKEYDSDNSLKSLVVENYQIIPNFSKDVLEYSLEVDESVEKVNIKAEANSSKAEVIGIGEKNLSQGNNTVEVKVTAENGNERIYKIIITVKDQHPIEVMIGKNKYTLLKKNNNILDKINFFEEDIIEIDGQKVMSYYNSTTKTRLVILKDEDNKARYYVYRVNQYDLYRYVTVGNITLQLLNPPTVLSDYQKYQLKIGEEQLDIFKIKESHEVGLIYGTNVKTGNTGYYVYDSNEDTLSRYYDEEVKLVRNQWLDFKNKVMIFMGIVSIVVIFCLITSLYSFKRKRKRYAR